MTEQALGIHNENRHYTSFEVFKPEIKQIRGFIEESYNKGLHSQEFYEINIVLSGKANHYIGKRRITVSAGDTFIIPPNVMHGYDGGKGFDVYHILINPKYLERHSSELQLLPSFSSLFRIDPYMRERTTAKLHFRLTEAEIASLRPRLDALTISSKLESITECTVSSAEAMIIIARLCEIYERRAPALSTTVTEDSAFLASIAHLYEHYGDALTVDALARIAQMSRNAYITKFKRVTGQAPAKFLRRHRVDMAKQMLIETTLTEAEIAVAVGFTDTSHLIKVFLSELGVTPSSFRRREI